MITDLDILRILSDPRFERTVTAIIRKRFSNYKEEEEEDEVPQRRRGRPRNEEAVDRVIVHQYPDRPLDVTLPTLDMKDACEKYGLTMEELAEAVQNKWVLSEDGRVDQHTVEVWLKGRKAFLQKKAEQEAKASAPPAPKDRRAPALRTATEVPEGAITHAEAADRLGISFTSIAPLVTKGTLRWAARGCVTADSVERYKEKRGTSHKYQVVVQPEGSISYHEAAVLLGIKDYSLPQLVTTNKIRKAAPGYVYADSVEAFRLGRDERFGEPAQANTELEQQAADLLAGEATPPRETLEPLSFAQAAERFGYTESAVRMLVGLGKLNAVGEGRVLASDMHAYHAKRTGTPAPATAGTLTT